MHENRNFLLILCLIIFGYECLSEPLVIIKNKDIPELKYLNTSVDPCENFYEYACGNFQKYHPLEDATVVNQFTILSDEILKTMKGVLGLPIQDADPEFVKKLKTAYNSCVDLELADARRPLPEVLLLAQTDGMPVFEKPPSKFLKFGWNEIANFTATYGIALLFSITVIPFPITTKDILIMLDEDKFPNPSMAHPHHELHVLEMLAKDFEKYANELETQKKHIKPFDTYLQSVLRILRDNVNPNVTNEDLSEAIRDVATFMRNIHRYAGVPQGSTITPLASTTYVGDLQKWTEEQFPNETVIDWLNYFDITFGDSGAKVDNNTYIYVNSTYIYNVLNLVKNTDAATLKNFVLLRIILYSSVDSNWQMRTAFFDYYKTKNNTIYSRGDYCARQLLDVVPSDMVVGLSIAAGKLYEETIFDNTKITKSQEMMQDISNALKNSLETSEWMDDESKLNSLRKINNSLSLLGLPDFSDNDTEMNEFYQKLEISDYDNYGNMQRLRAFKQAYFFSQVGKARDRNHWDKSPFDTNAFYNRANNKIIIPLALMNPVFFKGDLPLIDYSHLGMLLGHEMTHGFDNEGKRYNENATLGNLWTNETLLAFQNKTECFSQQYGKYMIEELNKTVDGSSTLNENLADNGGLRIAYNSAKKFFKSYKLESEEFSTEQLFFIGFGTTFCSLEKLSYLEYTSSKGYAPSKYRIIGSVSNMKEFSDAFNCPRKSGMNPDDKCSLW